MPSVITDKIMHDVKYQKLLVNVNPLWCHGHWPICHGVPLRGWWNKLTTESLACLGLISLSPFKVLVSMPAFLRLFWFGEFFCFLVIKALTSCLEKTVYTKKQLPDKNQKKPKSVDLKTKHIQAITATTRTGVDAQPQKQEVGGGGGGGGLEREREMQMENGGSSLLGSRMGRLWRYKMAHSCIDWTCSWLVTSRIYVHWPDIGCSLTY